jgi:dihydroorotate dehydrogenase electron transfer subunit
VDDCSGSFFIDTEGFAVKKGIAPTKGRFMAEVRGNKPINPHHYRLTLSLTGAAAEAFAGTVPGQFAQFDASDLALPPVEMIPPHLRDAAGKRLLLRRPLSFADVRREPGGEVVLEVLFCVLGPATVRMTTLAAGDRISLIGPLGRGFTVPEGKRQVLLVAGGMGAPPLQHMAAWLHERHPDVSVLAFAGARTLLQLPYTVDKAGIKAEPSLALAEFARHGVKSLVATDDGSAGHKGFVTDMLSDWLAASKVPASDVIIHTCGPEVMMSAVAGVAAQYGIDCQVSMERMMACGIGLCQSCAVECKAEGADTVYRLCCKDGAVFDSKEIAWGKGK